MRMRLKGIHAVTSRLADGSLKTYYYHRPTKARIDATPGTPEFLRQYAALVKAPRADTGNLHSLIAAYKASADFMSLADKTRKDYRRYLDLIGERFGQMEVEVLNDKAIRGEFFAFRDSMMETPRKADYMITVAGAVLWWAYDAGRISVNHLTKPGRLYESERSEIIWIPKDIAAFMAAGYPELNMAVAFAMYTGQRQCDLLALGPQHLKDGGFEIFQRPKGRRKTKGVKRRPTRVWVPLHRDLAAMIGGLPDRLVYLVTATGRPWRADHFRHEVGKVKAAAGLAHLHFHDLRGTAVTMLAEAGCTVPEIATITGHTQRTAQDILDRYLARTRNLALSAIRKLENATATRSVKRL